MPGQTSSPSSGSPGPRRRFQIVRGTTRPSIGASDEQRFGGRHRAVAHARGPIPLQLEDGELGGRGLALQRDRLAQAGQLRLGRLEVQRVLLRVDARQHVVLGGLEPRQREVVLGGLDRRVVDGVLQLHLRLLLADVFLELLPLGLLVDRLPQRHLAIELDDEVALLDGRPLRRDADDRQLAAGPRGRPRRRTRRPRRGRAGGVRRRRSGALGRHRGGEQQACHRHRQHARSKTSPQRRRAGHGGRSLCVRGTPMIVPRGDATKQPSAAVSIQLGSDLHAHHTRTRTFRRRRRRAGGRLRPGRFVARRPAGGRRHRQLAAVPRSQPRWQVGRYQPAEAVGRRRPRFGLEGVRSRDGLFEPVDRRRPPLHDGGPRGQPVRHRAVRGRRQAAVEGQGRADLAGPLSRAAGDADRRRRAGLQPRHRRRPGVPRGRDRQGALAQEPGRATSAAR